MTAAVNIARCAVHGLHGERSTCFAFEHEGCRDCDGSVEQVPMVPADYFTDDELDWLEGAATRAAEDPRIGVARRELAALAAKVEALRGTEPPDKTLLVEATEMPRLRAALEDIASRPVVEINPDGDDQAAWTMQLIAREALGLAPRQSSCCHAGIRTAGDLGEGTRYSACENCGEPCDQEPAA